MSDQKITSEMKNLSSVLLENNSVYHIPDFQRDFVWGREEIDALFRDFSEDTNNFESETSDLPGYLLGNIVLIKNEDNYSVVDGQQRLTTLTLVFKVLYETILKKIQDTAEDPDAMKKWSKKLSDLDKGYQNLTDEDVLKSHKITHETSLNFGDVYKHIINGEKELNVSDKNSDNNVQEVFQSIEEKINELSDDQLNRFISYIKTKVMLIVTIAPSQAKAFQLFEVLNNRGRTLEPLDLIKNLFLKKLSIAGYTEESKKNFNNSWKEFLENLQLDKRKILPSTTFMKYFIVNKFSINIRTEELYNFFDPIKQLSGDMSAEKILPFTKELEMASKVYASIEKDAKTNLFLKDDYNMYTLFKILGIKQFHPLLMHFYNADIKQKESIIDDCVRFGAATLFSLTQTNTIEKEIPIIIKKISNTTYNFEEKAKIVNSHLNEKISELIPRLKNTLSTESFGNVKGDANSKASNLLKFIELYLNKNTYIISVPKDKKITVEHILSRKLDIDTEKYGCEDTRELKEYLNKIGNLTLLYNADNSSLGNSTFQDKKETYEKSDFRCTSTIIKPWETAIKGGKTKAEFDLINELQPQYNSESLIWDKNSIDERSNNIAELMARILMG